MTTTPWDDPEIKDTGEYYGFENVGDVASGVITFVGTHRYDDGKLVPSLSMIDDDGTEKKLNAGQVRLKAELVEQRPAAGDHLRVTLSNIEKRAGGKTLKHFTVQVTRGHAPHLAQAAPPAAVAAPVAAYVPPAAPVAVAPPVAPPVAVPGLAYVESLAPPPAAPAVAPPPDPAAAAAALAALSPEQRAALGLPPA